MKNKRFLCVDGDFFCHRALHGIRMVNKNITLDSVDEMNNFNKTNGDYFNRLIKKNDNRKFPKYKYNFQLKDTSKSLWSVGSPENAERFFLNSNFLCLLHCLYLLLI